ncbi:MAG: hypothetical protein ACREC5_05360, partial [Thermoplasmata archaeon]
AYLLEGRIPGTFAPTGRTPRQQTVTPHSPGRRPGATQGVKTATRFEGAMSAARDDWDRPARPRSVLDLPLDRQVVFFGFTGLTLLGVLFYLWWGLSYGVWIDNGVYAVVITLLLFGLGGMWLMMPNPPAPAPPPEHY